MVKDDRRPKRSKPPVPDKEHLLDILESAGVVYFDFDPITRRYTFNDRFYEFLGTTAEAEGGYKMSFDDFLDRFIPSEEQPMLRRRIDYLSGSSDVEQPPLRELKTIGRDGRVCFSQIKSRLVKDDSGRVVKIEGVVQDVTEHREMEKELRKSEERYRLLAENSNDYIWLVQLPSGKPIYISPSAKRILGYSPEEMLAMKPDDSHTPESAARVRHHLEEIMASLAAGEHPEELTMEVEHIHKNGYIVPMESNIRFVYDQSGAPVGIQGANRDITARKRAEEEIRSVRDRLSEAMELGGLVDFEVDIENREFIFNDPFYAFLGTTAEAEGGYRMPVDVYLSRFVPVDDMSEIRRRLNDLEGKVSDDVLIAHESGVIRKNGEVRHVLVSAGRVARDSEGRTMARHSTMLDITTRKLMEEALQKSEEHYRLLAENNNDVIWVVEIPSYRNVYVSPSVERLLGYTTEEAMNIRPDEMVTPASVIMIKSKLGETMSAALRGEPDDSFRLEMEQVHKDGTTIWVESNIRIIYDQSGAVVGLQGVNRDIRERKQAEAALAKRTEELARSNAELEQFAYIASHDLQEPLRMISSYTGLLEKRYAAQFDDEAKEFMTFIVEGAARMKQLIVDLLTYSRAGTRKKAPTLTDSREVLNNVLMNLKMTIEDHNAEISSGTLPTIMVDPVQLGQLLQNLIGNAIKFHGQEPPCIHISSEERGNEWLFSVNDNGIGIEPQYFHRIFMIFQRLHRRKDYEGTGIGLAVCKKIVENFGGQIWVESEPGKGSTFFFTVPKS